MAMTIGAITTGVQSVTATGAVTPTAGLDVSGITGDFTLFVQVQSNTAAKAVRIQLEESTNAFTAATALAVVDVKSTVSSAADKIYSFRKYELPSTVFGTANAVVRANVTAMDSADTLGLRAWVEY